MKTKFITPATFHLLFCLFSFVSCQPKKEDASVAISENIDKEMVQLADINVERINVSEKYLGDFLDKRHSDLIKEYEKSKDFVSKVNSLDQLIREDKFTSADKPSPQETKRGGYPGVIYYLAGDNFDLSIKSNDAFVAQVKFMNSKFKTLDQSAVDAINFYDRLTLDQKKQYFNISNKVKIAGTTPAPDYKEYISRELLRGYNHYQYHLQALFYNYYKQKTLNLLKGFDGARQNNGQTAQLLTSDKQFDLSISGKH